MLRGELPDAYGRSIPFDVTLGGFEKGFGREGGSEGERGPINTRLQ